MKDLDLSRRSGEPGPTPREHIGAALRERDASLTGPEERTLRGLIEKEEPFSDGFWLLLEQVRTRLGLPPRLPYSVDTHPAGSLMRVLEHHAGSAWASLGSEQVALIRDFAFAWRAAVYAADGCFDLGISKSLEPEIIHDVVRYGLKDTSVADRFWTLAHQLRSNLGEKLFQDRDTWRQADTPVADVFAHGVEFRSIIHAKTLQELLDLYEPSLLARAERLGGLHAAILVQLFDLNRWVVEAIQDGTAEGCRLLEFFLHSKSRVLSEREMAGPRNRAVKKAIADAIRGHCSRYLLVGLAGDGQEGSLHFGDVLFGGEHHSDVYYLMSLDESECAFVSESLPELKFQPRTPDDNEVSRFEARYGSLAAFHSDWDELGLRRQIDLVFDEKANGDSPRLVKEPESRHSAEVDPKAEGSTSKADAKESASEEEEPLTDSHTGPQVELAPEEALARELEELRKSLLRAELGEHPDGPEQTALTVLQAYVDQKHDELNADEGVGHFGAFELNKQFADGVRRLCTAHKLRCVGYQKRNEPNRVRRLCQLYCFKQGDSVHGQFLLKATARPQVECLNSKLLPRIELAPSRPRGRPGAT